MYVCVCLFGGSHQNALIVNHHRHHPKIVRDSAWPDYKIAFTGTTIWRALLPLEDLTAQDPRFGTTGWWHLPTSHVYFSPVGEGLGEIASREYQDPAVHSASKVVWGVPVTNEHVESHFKVCSLVSLSDAVTTKLRRKNMRPMLTGLDPPPLLSRSTRPRSKPRSRRSPPARGASSRRSRGRSSRG